MEIGRGEGHGGKGVQNKEPKICVTTRTTVSAGIRSRIRRGRAPYATPQWLGGKLGTGRGIGPVCRMGWDARMGWDGTSYGG